MRPSATGTTSRSGSILALAANAPTIGRNVAAVAVLLVNSVSKMTSSVSPRNSPSARKSKLRPSHRPTQSDRWPRQGSAHRRTGSEPPTELCAVRANPGAKFSYSNRPESRTCVSDGPDPPSTRGEQSSRQLPRRIWRRRASRARPSTATPPTFVSRPDINVSVGPGRQRVSGQATGWAA